jgi:hypothetical protein
MRAQITSDQLKDAKQFCILIYLFVNKVLFEIKI